MSGSGRKALYLCTHSITSILCITPYFSVHSMSPCLHTCICVVPVAEPLFPVPVPRQGYAVGPDRGNRGKGNSVNNTIHTIIMTYVWAQCGCPERDVLTKCQDECYGTKVKSVFN